MTPHSSDHDLSAAGAPCERWDVADGIAGYTWRTTSPRGAVVLQHGYGDHTTAYLNRNSALVPRLLEAGMSVFGMDMPGNGRSSGVPGGTDVHRAVQLHHQVRLRAAAERVPVFLLAHSLGALVTATSALQATDDIAGIVMIAPAIKYDVGPLTRALARLGARVMPDRQGPMPAGTLDSLTRVPEIAAQMRSDPLMYLGRVRWVTLGSAATISHANWTRYQALRMPLLAVHGTDDVNTDPDGSRQFIEAAKSSDKTLHLVPGGRHALLDDTDRLTTLDVIAGWLDQRTGSAWPKTQRHR